MKKILIILFTILFIGCGNKITPKTHYINVDVVIVSINQTDGFTREKYPKPTAIKQWLVRLVQDTTMYRELSSNEETSSIGISDEMWYSHKVGDTLHYDYLIKSRFFKIKRRGNK